MLCATLIRLEYPLVWDTVVSTACKGLDFAFLVYKTLHLLLLSTASLT
jgi:hypothetical protein